MSSGKFSEKGFSFEFGGNQQHYSFSLQYDEINDVYVVVLTNEVYTRSDESPLAQSNTRIVGYVDAKKSRIFENESFWERIPKNLKALREGKE